MVTAQGKLYKNPSYPRTPIDIRNSFWFFFFGSILIFVLMFNWMIHASLKDNKQEARLQVKEAITTTIKPSLLFGTSSARSLSTKNDGRPLMLSKNAPNIRSINRIHFTVWHVLITGFQPNVSPLPFYPSLGSILAVLLQSKEARRINFA